MAYPESLPDFLDQCALRIRRATLPAKLSGRPLLRCLPPQVKYRSYHPNESALYNITRWNVDEG